LDVTLAAAATSARDYVTEEDNEDDKLGKP
jgi:hypothetical protein